MNLPFMGVVVSIAYILVAPLCQGGAGAAAQATATVPPLDPAYGEVEVLRSAGLVGDLIHGQRPYSRTTFSRIVDEAGARLAERESEAAPSSGNAEAVPPRVREAFERLERRFADTQRLRSGSPFEEPRDGIGCLWDDLCFRLDEARADFTWAESPYREVPTRYLTSSATEPRDNIDAALNPLLDGDLGRRYADGYTGSREFSVAAQVGSHIAAYGRVRGYGLDPRDSDYDAHGRLQQGYIRGVFGNFAMQVGRDHVFLGQGEAAGTVVSHNAPSFDLIRLSNARPFRLPWVFDALGPTALSFVAADLGGDRDTEHAKLFLTKLSVRPHPNLELGATLLNIQGGEGAPDAPFWQRVQDVLLPGLPPREFSEKLAGIDARLTLPDPGVELYVDLASTDVQFLRIHEVLWDEAAWVVGASIPSWGPEGRFAARAEWRRNGVRPYTHHQFTSGLTLDRRIMGSPLGPMATGLMGELGWSATSNEIVLTAAWERYLGDLYRHNGLQGGDYRWNKIADNPDETRIRLFADWAWTGIGDRFRPAFRLGWESVDRFNFTDEDRTNWVARLILRYRW